MRLLLIEDDDILGEGLRDYLRADGHAVDWFRSLGQAEAARGEPFDAWLLDWQLPDGSGLEWLRARRARGDATPALMLTARDRLGDRVSSLDGGADDYLIKPFAFAELRARIRALLRREPALTGPLLQVADLTLDTVTHEVHRGGQLIALTNKEYSLLEFLMRHPNQTLTRATIADHVWNYEFDNVTNVIDVHIFALRRKLDDASPAKLLHTVRGVGYRLGTGAE